MADFDINAHLRQSGFGQQQQAAADEVKVNEDEIGKLLEVAPDKAIFTAAKVAMAIPVVGWLLEMIFPFNPGKAGLDAGLNSEGLMAKQVLPGNRGAQGGVLAKIAGELVKNSAITDHTTGVGGSGEGGGAGDGGSSGSGWSDSGGNQSFESSFAGLDSGPIILAGGGNQFDYSDIPRSSLGELRPSFTPNMGGQGIGAGMDFG